MTDDQLNYNYNARRCKHLASMLEILTENAHYYEKSFLYHKIEGCNSEVSNIRAELEVLWDRQIELFFRIQEEGLRKHGK